MDAACPRLGPCGCLRAFPLVPSEAGPCSFGVACRVRDSPLTRRARTCSSRSHEGAKRAFVRVGVGGAFVHLGARRSATVCASFATREAFGEPVGTVATLLRVRGTSTVPGTHTPRNATQVTEARRGALPLLVLAQRATWQAGVIATSIQRTTCTTRTSLGWSCIGYGSRVVASRTLEGVPSSGPNRGLVGSSSGRARGITRGVRAGGVRAISGL